MKNSKISRTTMKGLTLAALLAAGPAALAQITFYEHPDFHGRSFTAEGKVGNFERYGFNDRASSAIVTSERWEVCEHQRYEGRCVVLRRGNYPSLQAMGLDDRISSVRAVRRDAQVDEDRYAPPPVSVYDGRRRPNERLYQADVVAVRAIVGPPQQRCWVEQQQVNERENANVGGAVAGAIIGGILGHQVGGGNGRDIATAGGVLAGAALGANVGRDDRVVTRDVQRCSDVSSQARPDYWDVTYVFRGQEHHAQMTAPPGRTLTVNANGEPRA
ncbi:beta/gamma crystallin-related protein [Roseateles violae]|uniref:Beta/gamma crystallin-related protein n=1 Tax=Roseateles violae TaxID=3058042 RepID=A0ABT8DLA7_9BURK|nr:beta/gamma crystallin-related protein [Pelomonas sp. PFR6]MDN3919195.1 beta/gamma crystallin-related protein [Pelomonas sp. PFR6]